MTEWFKSFDAQVSAESYEQLARTVIPWLEGVDFAQAGDIMSSSGRSNSW